MIRGPQAASRSIEAPTSRTVPITRSMFSEYATRRSTERVGELLAEIGERRDRAVGKHLHRSFAVAQHDRSQVDLLDAPGDAVDPREIADPDLILENQKEPRDDVAHQVLRAESDREPGDSRPRQDGQNVDRQLAQQHQHGDEHHTDRHDARQNPAERRCPALPFEVALDVMPPDLVLQVLDRQVGGPHHHVCARDDDDEVDAVCSQPAADGPRIPLRIADPDARKDERDAGQRRDAVQQQGQRAGQLLRAGLNRRRGCRG